MRLGDVGNVLNAVSNPRSGNWYNGARTIVLSVRRQPGSNTVKVAEAVQRRVEELRPQLPPAIEVNMLYDRAQTIRESVADVKFTLGLTLCLVVLVIFLFLRNVPATVIPSLALPMSVVGTFAVMALILGDLALIGLDELFAEHLREAATAFLGHDRVEIAIEVPVFRLLAELEQLAAAQVPVEAILQFFRILLVSPNKSQTYIICFNLRRSPPRGGRAAAW